MLDINVAVWSASVAQLHRFVIVANAVTRFFSYTGRNKESKEAAETQVTTQWVFLQWNNSYRSRVYLLLLSWENYGLKPCFSFITVLNLAKISFNEKIESESLFQ